MERFGTVMEQHLFCQIQNGLMTPRLIESVVDFGSCGSTKA
jgi:hypothetical protein